MRVLCVVLFVFCGLHFRQAKYAEAAKAKEVQCKQQSIRPTRTQQEKIQRGMKKRRNKKGTNKAAALLQEQHQPHLPPPPACTGKKKPNHTHTHTHTHTHRAIPTTSVRSFQRRHDHFTSVHPKASLPVLPFFLFLVQCPHNSACHTPPATSKQQTRLFDSPTEHTRKKVRGEQGQAQANKQASTKQTTKQTTQQQQPEN